MTQGFWRFAEEHPDRIAVVEHDGSTVTFGALHAGANRLAHALREIGARRGDRVAVLLPNCAAFVEAYAAAVQIGLYFTPINWHLKPAEVAYILENSGAVALIAHERFAETAVAAADEARVSPPARLSIGAIPGFRPTDDAKEAHPSDPPSDRSAGWVMVYTGGTTGRPKGVRRPLMDVDPETSAMMLATLSTVFGAPMEPGVHLVTGPMYHSAPLAFGVLTSLHLGSTLVLMDRWTPEGTLERIERYGVTTTHLVPTMFVRLLKLPADVRRRYDTSSLRLAIHGAAPCPVHVKRAMIDWWGPVLGEYYAGTEGGGTYVGSEQWLEKPGTVGPPMPGATVKILDDDGTELAPGHVGTVYMTTLIGGFEYHDDPEKTAAAHRGDLFTLGDMGYLDDDGWLFLADRKIDMIISGGVNIYPAEVEAAILEHPAVADCAVIGVPHDEWGEEVKAVVELVDAAEATEDLGREIIDWCRDRIAHYKCPRSVEFRDALPRNEMGKLSKRAIREPFWRGRERAI